MLRQPFRLARSRIVLVVMWLTEKAKVFNLVVIWVFVQMSNLSGLHRSIALKGKTNRASAATPREEVRFGCFRDLRAFRHVETPTPSVSVLPNIVIRTINIPTSRNIAVPYNSHAHWTDNSSFP